MKTFLILSFSFATFIPIIGMIIDGLKRYTQDYLITYIVCKDGRETSGRTLRQQTGYFKRKISCRDLELLEIQIVKENNLDNCVVVNVIKLKGAFFSKGKENLLTDEEIERLFGEPGPRLMK